MAAPTSENPKPAARLTSVDGAERLSPGSIADGTTGCGII
jgi:hypothetical protein